MADETDVKIVSKKETEEGWKFSLEVEDGGRVTQHTVTVSKQHLTKFKYTKPDELVLASFLFLLDHEDNESILPTFALTEITNYFPKYEEQVENYL